MIRGGPYFYHDSSRAIGAESGTTVRGGRSSRAATRHDSGDRSDRDDRRRVREDEICGKLAARGGLNCGAGLLSLSEVQSRESSYRIEAVTMTTFLRSYSLLLIANSTASIPAMGEWPLRYRSPDRKPTAPRSKKWPRTEEGGRAGHDRTWVRNRRSSRSRATLRRRDAGPPDRGGGDARSAATDLLECRAEPIKEGGIREEHRVGIQYSMTAPRPRVRAHRDNRMESATAEISRSQLW